MIEDGLAPTTVQRELPLARGARERYGYQESLSTGAPNRSALGAARRLARSMAARLGPDDPRSPGARELQAMALIHEGMHRFIEARAGGRGGGLLGHVLGRLRTESGSEALDEALRAYLASFPPAAVLRDEVGIDEYLVDQSDGRPHRQLLIEELLLLWLANRNPAFNRHGELFDERPVASASQYARIVEAMRRHLAPRDAVGDDLVSLLRAPAVAAPGSLAGQLSYIREHWPEARGLVDAAALDLQRLAAEERGATDAQDTADPADVDDDIAPATPAFGIGGPGATDSEALHRFAGLETESERYSPDGAWMPRTVIVAKSTYVWLDQLSRRYERPIRALDAVPDEELDALASQGMTGLWLIGVWERSVASRLIKQRLGNPEAVASAYSLMDYRISEDLGGEDAFASLRSRAMARGIRLACDMVPNHMGIDSRWVVEHPDFFISRPDSPFDAYSFDGPNLSGDERVGIYLEDHYDDASDAAVVFRRVDRWSGEERFVYHGNDGTGMPWNDTAQLDFVRPEVREAVIHTILAVARRAPIIRFDAAMTLARRHVQRLWYPIPGSGESIPSRALSAMDPREFATRMPHEFWREVVDRVAQEAPDTLLMAEAFWLMEGYFVRSLGMHRVYNSAFMHMLRDEDNAGYRTVLRNTLAFDPGILKRYVNFMTNPDERTAVDQFGNGDKYLGVATLMATLPGLPMFGHGQVEGFAERYGMEFRRARLDEAPDTALVHRHEREIFPLLHQRALFSEARDFALYDLVSEGGSVEEDVYAYTNTDGARRSLVVFQNRSVEARGRIHRSVPMSRPTTDGRTEVVASLGEALGLPAQAGAWVVLRDLRSGREWLRACLAIHEQGLDLELAAYDCRVYLDPLIMWDDGSGDLGRLAARLGGRSVADVAQALHELIDAPVREAIEQLIDGGAYRRIAGAALARDESAAEAMLAAEGKRAADVCDRLARTAGGSHAQVVPAMLDRLRALTSLVRSGRRAGAGPGRRRLAEWLATDRARWAVVLGWVHADALHALAEGHGSGDGWMNRRGVDQALAAAARELGLDEEDAWRAVEMTGALVATPMARSDDADAAQDAPPTHGHEVRPFPPEWFESDAVRTATHWHRWEKAVYVEREAFEGFLDAIAARELTLLAAAGEDDAALDVVIERTCTWRDVAAAAGWRVTMATGQEDG